ncbi:MAG: ornithine cyclodeaminase family protein [Burkholderiales bacterium]|nr:ornithine cyclodeaminase family protein [Burkholderiales bacterium]
MESVTSATTPIVLAREPLSRRLGADDYFEAAQSAFRAHARGRTHMPLPMHIEAAAGGFHAKGALVELDRAWVAVKVNSNFPGNPARGLPTIQGGLLLFDATNGALVAILDSIEITSKRTAAASALAAVHLARRDAHTVAMLGCGEQGRSQLAALARVRPIQRALAWDCDPAKARIYAQAMSQTLGLRVDAVPTITEATQAAQIVVTATTSREPLLRCGDVLPGTFIAAVGADNPHKSELHPDLFVGTTVVVDSLEQAVIMGDLHHAIDAGMATLGTVHAELAEVVDGRKPGRRSEAEITIFDSTGLAIQDVAAAALAYTRFTEGA